MTPRPARRARRARPAAAPAAAFLLLLAARLRSVAALDGAPPPARPPMGRIVGPGTTFAPAAGAVVGVMTAANRPEDAYLYCTGSLIAPDAALTAAHCVADQAKGLVLVNATEDPSCGTTSDAEVVPWQRSDLYVHPRYTGGGVHDLAIIHLNFPVTSVVPAPLGLRRGVEKRCKQGEIFGWGDTDNRGTSDSKPCLLRKAEVPMWSVKKCEKQQRKKQWSSIDCKTECSETVCAGEVNSSSSGRNKPGTNTCFGDSGGPLIDSCTGRLVGVTSYGSDGRCGYSSPDRFARLADRRNVRWLKGLAAQGVVSLPESVFPRRGA